MCQQLFAWRKYFRETGEAGYVSKGGIRRSATMSSYTNTTIYMPRYHKHSPIHLVGGCRADPW